MYKRQAWDLLQKPEIWVRKLMGIHGVRMINELKGIPQLVLDEASAKKSIATTRSFMEMITEKEQLRERIETFAFSCAEKLRKQNSCCKMITVFVHTNRFRKELGAVSYTHLDVYKRQGGGLARLWVRSAGEESAGQAHHQKAHWARRGRDCGQPPRPQRQVAGGGENLKSER